MQKIITNLWFDTQAEEAARFYTGIFQDSKMGKIARYGKEGFEFHGKPEGTVMTAEFTIEGRDFIALNGGPVFRFNESISLVVNCNDQAEIDYYWENLSEGGDPAAQVCGWLKDRFGLSWQIVPTILSELFSDPDPIKSARAMDAMYKMKKLDIAALQKAHRGE